MNLDNVVVGDKLYVLGRYSGSIHTVTRLTEKQVITDKDYRFWKKDGYEVGKSSRFLGWISARLATLEDIAKVEDGNRMSYLRNVKWEHVPAEKRKQICDLLQHKETEVAQAE